MRIARDGTWFYRGSPIGRKPLVKLFSTVLRRENGEFWLVTPVERGRILVDDAPFVAVEVDATGEGRNRRLTFRTNVDDTVTVDEGHPIRVDHDPASGEPSPYVTVRGGLEARILRPVYYHLVELGEFAERDGVAQLGVWSCGHFFRWAGSTPNIPHMQRSEVIARLGKASPGRRSAPGTTPPASAPNSVFNAEAAGQRGDHDLNPGMHPDRALTAAAVLVPLIDRAEGLTVLLTKRTDHLHDHAGQVSFPGGRVEPEDRDAAAAALREAKEEVGLDPQRVDLVGRLDTYVTRTGFEVTPWVGLVMPPIALVPDPFEVAEVFEVPLHFFLEPANRRTESRVWQGKERFFYVYPWHGYHIWGATAGMLSNLAEVLRAEAGT